MSEEDADQFERFRPRLTALAYRMLGTTSDAEDAVQDAYIRFHRHVGEIESIEGWLVRVTTRLCIDRKRFSKRDNYVGNWLPEPLPEQTTWMEDREGLAESLSMAFMVILETLAPVERAAYLLRDIFGYEFEEVAELIEKSPANVRQIVVRARRRLGLREQRFSAETEHAEKLAETFYEACRNGELDRIERMLADNANLISDGGGNALASPKPLQGPHRIANLLAVTFRKEGRDGCFRKVRIGGQPSVAIFIDEQPVSVLTVVVRSGAIAELFVMRNPDKLRLWIEAKEKLNEPL